MISRRCFLRKSLFWTGALMAARPAPGRLQAGNPDRVPAYLDLDRRGELDRRVAAADAVLEACRLCPRACGVDRKKGEKGFCRAPSRLMVYAADPHFGEEVSLVGQGGSGTIFFSNCNLRCVFCQNWPIAHQGLGTQIDDRDLAGMMLHLQKIGCHNINLVTPTHVMPHILNAVRLASRQGLRLPLVYNTSGYETLEMLELLDGVVDIYLPDMKYMDGADAATYSAGASDYPGVARAAILQMHRQVGRHRVDEEGIAVGGLMIRHLVMPNGVSGTGAFVRWVAENLPRDTYVNIMHQYHVAYKAYDHPKIWRRITPQEFLQAMIWAESLGLTNLDPKSVEIKNFYLRRGQ
jgi:putative pyruvate formate lyase activating enzyme